MWFRRPIDLHRRQTPGLDFIRVEVPLTVVGGPPGSADHPFVFDTGCAVTTVSEVVAARLGLPAGGVAVNLGGSTARGRGRLVPVRFRFPNSPSGPGLVVSSNWIVTPGRTGVALLRFQEVHRHLQARTEQFEMWFAPWRHQPGSGTGTS